MPTYLSPGVYMEEVSSGSKPIEGVGTAVAAFVGFAEQGPINTPTLVTNWTQFVNNFGGFIEGSHLAHSVYAYFLNGGGVAYVVRIGAGDDSGKQPEKPDGEMTVIRAWEVRPHPAQPGDAVAVSYQRWTRAPQ